jgi:hypothetical protein
VDQPRSYLTRNHQTRHAPTAITSTTMIFVLSASHSRTFSAYIKRDGLNCVHAKTGTNLGVSPFQP